MENFRMYSHKMLLNTFTQIHFTIKTVKVPGSLRPPEGPDDPINFFDQSMVRYLPLIEKEKLYINDNTVEEYLDLLDDCKNSLFNEVDDNLKYQPNKDGIQKYLTDLHKDYESILNQIVQSNPPNKLPYDNPSLTGEILKQELTEGQLIKISAVFSKQNHILREIIDSIITKGIEYKNQTSKRKFVEKGYNNLKWNTEINKLVDLFYRLSRDEKTEEGKVFLETSNENLMTFILQNFVDSHGEPLSESTIRTILKPSRQDKRPPEDKQIKIPE